ncbi:unknown [Bacteroides sp. CAG:545]|nr:unknown [Bacteroides sp. CAG:545]
MLSIVSLPHPLASKNSSKSSGNICSMAILPIGIDGVCANAMPNSEPLAIYRYRPSSFRNFSIVIRCG